MTIAVDTSALSAILLAEPEAETFLEALETSEENLVSAVSLLEIRGMVLARFGEAGVYRLEQIIENNSIEQAPFDDAAAWLAYEGYLCFGEGRHPAQLALSDCAAYALAKAREIPLLFKNEGFRQTDVTPVL